MTAERRGTIHEVTGDGPPVVLVHGLGLNRHMWMWQEEALRPHFTVIRYDLLGHGESADPAIPCRMEEFVDQLLSVTERLGLARFGLVGFSLGGLIAKAFTLAHPDRVAALAIMNTAHDRTDAERTSILERAAQSAREGPGATVDAALERWFSPEFAARRRDVLDTVRDWVTANHPEVYPAVYRLLAEGDAPLAEAIVSIRCPTLVLTCEDDRGNSPEMTERMAARIPAARAAIIPGLRHMGLAEDPKAINDVLVPFLLQTVVPERIDALNDLERSHA